MHLEDDHLGGLGRVVVGRGDVEDLGREPGDVVDVGPVRGHGPAEGLDGNGERNLEVEQGRHFLVVVEIALVLVRPLGLLGVARGARAVGRVAVAPAGPALKWLGDLVVAADENLAHGETGDGTQPVAGLGDERADDVGQAVGGDLSEGEG